MKVCLTEGGVRHLFPRARVRFPSEETALTLAKASAYGGGYHAALAPRVSWKQTPRPIVKTDGQALASLFQSLPFAILFASLERQDKMGPLGLKEAAVFQNKYSALVKVRKTRLGRDGSKNYSFS